MTLTFINLLITPAGMGVGRKAPPLGVQAGAAAMEVNAESAKTTEK